MALMAIMVLMMMAITNKEAQLHMIRLMLTAQHLWSFTGEGSRNDVSLIMAIMTEMEGTANMIMSLFSFIGDYFKNVA